MLPTGLLRNSLVLLALFPGISWALITEDSAFFGESPPFYPSPQASGTQGWEDGYAMAKKLVARMTTEEKVNITTGSAGLNGCGGNIQAIERLGFPGMCLSDSGNGVRGTDFVSSWPAGIHVGASWNQELAKQRAVAMAAFSVDPYLSGALVHMSVTGIQSTGVIACTKHFIANEQEAFRSPFGNISAVSSNLDDVTLHEYYLWPFQDALRAGTGTIMCSYNRVNNSHACQNSKLLNGVLKHELGFQGAVISDWGALHAGYDAALAGLDMAMPDGGSFWGSKLVDSVKNHSISEARLDDMAVRIMSSWYKMSQNKGFPSPGIGMPVDLSNPHEVVDARSPSDKPILLKSAVEGHVLVKNTGKTLPLKKPKSVFLAGYSASAPGRSIASGSTAPGAYEWLLGYQSAPSYLLALGAIIQGLNPAPSVSPIAPNGTIIGGAGSGSPALSTFLSPYDALLTRATKDDTQLYWDFANANPVIPASSDACIVFGNAFASELFDRSALRDDYTDGLILNVAKQCSRTIVVLHNAGVRLVDQFISHRNVTAVIFAHLPGQDSGSALVSLLYGEENFSGKLPYTVARNESDYGDLLNPDMPSGEYQYFPQSDFKEGSSIDYRRFDAENITPRYEFGFGLSYTTFGYSKLTVRKTNPSNDGVYPRGKIVQGGAADLWDVMAYVSVQVANTGPVDGSEVAQLYVTSPGRGKQLRGFSKPFIKAGKATTVTFEVTRRDLSVWDPIRQAWKLEKGPHQIHVGGSSRNLPLLGTVQIS